MFRLRLLPWLALCIASSAEAQCYSNGILCGSVQQSDLSAYVKSVATVPPDSTGNVAGIATVPMVQSAIVDVIQMANSPASGATVQASAGTTVLFVNNPSFLVALTVGLPPSPADGQRFTVCTNSAITTMSVAGGTVKGALGSFSASGYARFIYSATLGAWFRAG